MPTKNPPKIFEGRKRLYSEVFKSPFEKDTPEEALKVLEQIRKTHPAEVGWVEFDAYVQPLSNGKYIAVRNHAKYTL